MANCDVHTSEDSVQESNIAKVNVSLFHSRCFYNKKYRPRDIESLLVRPCQQAVRVFKTHNIKKQSYASVVKHNNSQYCRDAFSGKHKNASYCKPINRHAQNSCVQKVRTSNSSVRTSKNASSHNTASVNKTQCDMLDPSHTDKNGCVKQLCPGIEQSRSDNIDTHIVGSDVSKTVACNLVSGNDQKTET